MNDALNRATIQRHEGLRLKVYPDQNGTATIAIGFNLEAGGAQAVCMKFGIDYQATLAGSPITEAQCNSLFEYSYAVVLADLIILFPGLNAMPDNVAAVLCDMRYELGYTGFREFHEFIAAVKAGDWKEAAVQMLDSKWAQEVPNRVHDDVAMMEPVA